MPDRIRLTALIANGFLCVAFGVLAVAGLATESIGMVVFFAMIAGAAGFNWYVIRKAARVLAEESWQLAELRQRLAEREANAAAPPPQGPPP